MTNDEIVKSIQLRPNIAHISEELLKDMVNDATNDVKSFIKYREDEEIPRHLLSVVKNMVLSAISRIGAEGISSQSFSGVSYNFIDGISPSDLKKLKRERRYTYHDKDSTGA